LTPLPMRPYPDDDELPADAVWPSRASRPTTREESRFLRCFTAVMHDHGVTLTPADRARALASFRDSHPKNSQGLEPIVDPANRRGQALAQAIEREFIIKYGCVLQ
jgi:hypothetical protein